MAEFDSLKKKLYSYNCKVEDLLQFKKVLERELLKSSVVNDLPKLLAGIFKYSLHEDVKFRNASISSLTNLVDVLDMNKHLKSKPWWADMKKYIVKRLDILGKLMSCGDDTGTVVWCEIVKMFGSDLKAENALLNRLLKMAEITFKATGENTRKNGFTCWKTLIDNFSINKQDLNNSKRLKLLVIPLKAKNHTTKALCAAKFETWMHLLTKIDQHNEITVELVLSNFLEFMFTPMGSIPPVCRFLDLDCAAVFLQLLKTANLFQIGQLPESMIEYSLICITFIHKKDPTLSVNIWESLLGNISHAQWADTQVTQLMNCLRKAAENEALARSQVFAKMIYRLYSVPYPMPSGVLMKHCNTLLLLMLEPYTLINFTETWCNELFKTLSKSDLVLLPGNVLSDIIHKLPTLSKSQMFREEKLKLLRGIWMEITHIFCRFISDNAQIGKNIDMKNEINNANILLSFGAAELSSMWNKLQMKSWKILYSESVKFCSLMPEADKFVSDLIDSLLEGIRLGKIPLHVAVDFASIILELHLSKDTGSILPLLLEIADKGLHASQSDNNGTSAVLNQFLKTIVTAAKNETALVNDILQVIDKMVEELPYSEKFRSMALKAQHQLQSLKPGRMQDKSLSPGSSSSTVQQASSPTMTSFLHRLAKAKESKSKMVSPTSSQSSEKSSSPLSTPNSKKISTQSSDKSSPLCTPNSKRISSPFVDEKSEDFVFVPPKTRKTILTDHQKEALTARKHDIPALYQDLSQDSSQSALESIVTSVKTYEEDVGKVKVLRSPKKQNKTFELGLKVITPKKINDSSSEEPNFKNSCQNQEAIKQNSPIGSPLDYTEQSNFKTQMKISPLKSNSQNKNETPMKKGNQETPKSNLRSRLRKSPVKGDDTSDQAHKPSIGKDRKAESKPSESPSSLSKTVTLFGKVLTTPPTTISSDVSMENNNEKSKSADVITLHSSDSESENDKVVKNSNNKNTPKSNRKINIKQTPSSHGKCVNKNKSHSSPNSHAKSPKNRTPKISPRRLRKRKSGVTPILGIDSASKKRLSLTRSAVDLKTTPTSFSKNQLTQKEDKSDEVAETLAQTEPSVEHRSTENVKPSETPNKLFISDETLPSELIKIKEDLKECKKTVFCSPVKVVLERVQYFEANPEITPGRILSYQNSNPKETDVKSDFIQKEVQNNKLMQQSNVDVDNTSEEDMCDDSTTKNGKEVRVKNKTSAENAKSLLENKKGNDGLHDDKMDQAPTSPIKCTRTQKNQTAQSQIKEKILENQKSQIDAELSYVNKIDCNDTVVLTPVESKPRTSKRINPTLQKTTVECFSDQQDSEAKTLVVQSSNKTKESSCLVPIDSKKEKNNLRQEILSKSTKAVDSEEKQETVCNHSNGTPVKHGQKNFKQTQLPFIPVSKDPDSKSEDKEGSLSTSPKKLAQKDSNLEGKTDHPVKLSPLLVLDKLNSATKSSDMLDHLIKPFSTQKEESICITTDDLRNTPAVETVSCCDTRIDALSPTKQRISTRLKSNNPNVQQTPEKISAPQSLCSKNTTLETEIPCSDESLTESPTKPTESEDIIASSQETVTVPNSVSFRIAGNSSGPLSPPKILTKSPKKSDNHNNNISDRTLRSSPLKTDSCRLSNTPIKKSVCRRLDVEIENDATEELKPLRAEERVNSKLEMLNKETLLGKNKLEEKPEPHNENKCVPTPEENEINKDGIKQTDTNVSPTSKKDLKRTLIESESSQIESPKRFLGSLKLENAGSPKSPSSRTNQMMELAMQDKEKIISSPVNSAQKRRIHPIKLGPLSRTPKNQSPAVVVRTHSGPSEEWVRRIYSPTASPNSSILKRKLDTPLDSPDSSPPSSKKKRVSFLDPPVSESLLFSKADPGKGQVQRTESKKENESEEVPTQGTVELELSPEKLNSEVKVFSPLKECPHPITDILGRISSDQWLPELESSLERLGVTSVGHLCSLSEGTVQRLPFRTPNIETLRKILQNYYNETSARIEPHIPENENADNLVEDVTELPDLNENIQDLPQNECTEGTSVDSLAEQINQQLEQYPDLIPALGNTLSLRTLARILTCFTDKLCSHVGATS